MQNPLGIPAPESPLERTVAFARDLAYGVYMGWWRPDFQVEALRGLRSDPYSRLSAKYGNNEPDLSYLVILGYAEPFSNIEDRIRARYILTQAALKLLEQPARPPSVFIAYGREQSSALALLIEEKLKSRNASVFIDKVLVGGEEWQTRIERTIKEQIDTFICLIGPGSLDRPNLQNEIVWSSQVEGLLTVPVWHRGFTYDPDVVSQYDAPIRDFIEKKNAIRVIEESAREYEAALSQLLNLMQYSGVVDTTLPQQ